MKIELTEAEVKQAILDYVNARVQGEFNTVKMPYSYINSVTVTQEQEQEDAAQ